MLMNAYERLCSPTSPFVLPLAHLQVSILSAFLSALEGTFSMYLSSLLACAASISTTLSTNPAFTQQNGRTKLLGSSFGVLGSNKTFDYVVRAHRLRNILLKKTRLMSTKIIGGGTSGLTVANRLAANPAVSVAVIEGGSFYEIDNGNYSQIPVYDTRFSSPSPTTIQPLVDWGIVTLPQTVCTVLQYR